MEKIDKEKILEMLCSEDKELRQLGISILEQNYIIPNWIYLRNSYKENSVFSFKPLYGGFTFNTNDVLYGIIECSQFYRKSTIETLIETIIEHNERIKKD